MPSVTTNGPFPNRITLNCAPFTGPFLFPFSPPNLFDPRRDVTCYVDGVIIQIVSFSFDNANNRYLLFASQQLNLQGVVQVTYHIPNPPFQDSLGAVIGGFALVGTFSTIGP